MGFLEILMGKRLLEDDLQRGMSELASSPKLSAGRQARAVDQFLQHALRELDRHSARWKPAGEAILLPSGDIKLPEFPDRPGILRLELWGPEPADLVVMLSEHASLKSDEGEGADQEIAAELLSGVRFVSSYLDEAPASGGQLDLSIAVNRASVLSAIEKQAERSGYWLLQQVGDRHALVPKPEAIR